MKVLMLRPTYKPEISGGTHLAVDLVSDLQAAGHEVELITPISEKYIALVDESTDECKTYRVKSRFNRKDTLSRVLKYIETSMKMYLTGKRIRDFDLIMTHSMPPLLGILGSHLAKKRHVPVLYWEQDIVSKSLLSTGVLGRAGLKQRILYRLSSSIERKTEQRSTHIVTISKQFKEMHLKRGIEDNKVSVVYNWIDTDQVYPVGRDENPLFDELGIPRDKYIVTYCGNLGIPQNVEIMIDAAEKLQDIDDLLFIIIGGGSREKYINEYVQTKALKNLKIFPLQSMDRSHLVYSLGDVSLVIGKTGTSQNGFPSKTWSIMSAGRPMIACFDLESELCEFVREGNCGLTVAPDSSDDLRKAVLYCYENKTELEKMGISARKYVSENFSRQSATGKIIDIAERLILTGDR